MEEGKAVLITGANGEVGHGLIPKLHEKGAKIIALDLHEIDESLRPLIHEMVVADILDKKILENIFAEHDIETIFHLAAVLSTGGERNPELAHEVNVGGTFSLLAAANKSAREKKKVIKFMFPSTIAVYGLPNIDTKNSSVIKEEEFLNPITMYGNNKLYCEQLGKYYSSNYSILTSSEPHIDFRCIRFPGIISALTVPTSGTSDYAPAMIHTAAQGESYESFVREDTTLPFVVMPDAVKALLMLSEAPKENLKQTVYNITGFSVTAKQIEEMVMKVFPNETISYNPENPRQKIVDSWPAKLDDSKARNDWGWAADFDSERAFNEYLIPEIRSKYK